MKKAYKHQLVLNIVSACILGIFGLLANAHLHQKGIDLETKQSVRNIIRVYPEKLMSKNDCLKVLKEIGIPIKLVKGHHSGIWVKALKHEFLIEPTIWRDVFTNMKITERSDFSPRLNAKDDWIILSTHAAEKLKVNKGQPIEVTIWDTPKKYTFRVKATVNRLDDDKGFVRLTKYTELLEVYNLAQRDDKKTDEHYSFEIWLEDFYDIEKLYLALLKPGYPWAEEVYYDRDDHEYRASSLAKLEKSFIRNQFLIVLFTILGITATFVVHVWRRKQNSKDNGGSNYDEVL